MKRRHLQFARESVRELDDALAWWAENRPAAPTLLKEELGRAFELIRKQPGVGTGRVGRAPVRRLHLNSVHYTIYYSISPDGSTVEVLSFWHSRRGAEPDV